MDPQSAPPPGSRENLDRSLTGRLPCVVCGYNLQTLSVVSVCPECGTAVRATILAMVDPLADELRPIRLRGGIAAAIVLWALAGVLAAGLAWAAGVAAAFPGTWSAGGLPSIPWAHNAVAIAVWVSGLGAIGMVRPHAAVPVRASTAALAAVAAYLPLGWVCGVLVERSAAALLAGVADPWNPAHNLSPYRLATGALLLVVIGGLRPNARLLVARCLALRTGRVDRQTMLAMAAAVMLVMIGDGVGLGAALVNDPTAAELMRTAGGTLMIVGALLLTIGLLGALADCVRIASSLLTPAPSPRQVLGSLPPAPEVKAARPPMGEDPATRGGGQ
jgi:hypothetical protein